MYPWETVVHYASYDPRWFETSDRYLPSDEHLAVYRSVSPGTWRLRRRGLWFISDPPGVAMPRQGWKLHVSALADESVDVLRAALPVLVGHAVPYKFLLDRHAVEVTSGKVFPRTASGKFITVYPVDDDHFHAVGEALASALKGRTGPYILSDRRWPGSTAVYYRYGGFVGVSRLRPDGARDLMISTPDGALTPDVRSPFWDPPAWVTDPHPPEEATDDGDLIGGRYEVLEALSLGNRGGVYAATDHRTGGRVVLKEARPGVLVGRPGRSAIEVLEKEHRLLVELADTGRFARPVELFTEWEHVFGVQERLDAIPFGAFTIARNPVVTLDLRPEALRDHFRMMRGLWRRIAEAVDAAHDRGILLGDLSHTNILVAPDGTDLWVIDLETAVRDGEDPHLDIHTPGLAGPRRMRTRRYDRDNDWYALGALILGSVFVVYNVTGLHAPTFDRYLTALTADLGLPAELAELVTLLCAEDGAPPPAEILRLLDALPFDDPAGWTGPVPLALPATDLADPGPTDAELGEVIDGVLRYVEATATPHRQDRLFPADLFVFESHPASVAYGAAGVLYGLERLGATVPARLVGWLLARDTGPDSCPPGLYTGQAGIAWVLDALGRPEAARALMAQAREHPLRYANPGIVSGAAGYGLACVHLSRRLDDDQLLADAVRAGEALAATAVHDDRGAHWPDGEHTPVGYGHGASGVALFLLSLYRATGDGTWYRLGRAALDFDLAQRVPFGNALLLFPRYVEEPEEGRVLRSYWDEGTAGVLTTALRYLAVHPDPELEALVRALLADTCRKYSVFPQLFHGLAGLGNVLLDAGEILGEDRWFAEARRTAAGVLLARVDRPEGIVFPGEQAIRESVDLATGSIGVALFLDRLRRAVPGGRTNFNFVVDGLLP
ncbi:class III lanthionine synthetase LanKC [Longispora sp. NPDC051575]|uniref:class III lanthionine synthetase LanKC n=1 Tax=Longispora sp. NPDC051575 TaxID=3154943 RepID=UPI00343C0587